MFLSSLIQLEHFNFNLIRIRLDPVRSVHLNGRICLAKYSKNPFKKKKNQHQSKSDDRLYTTRTTRIHTKQKPNWKKSAFNLHSNQSGPGVASKPLFRTTGKIHLKKKKLIPLDPSKSKQLIRTFESSALKHPVAISPDPCSSIGEIDPVTIGEKKLKLY